MTWEKPAAAILELFDKVVPVDDDVERRKMFGCPCVFVHGNMFLGVHEQNLILRLPPEARVAYGLEGAEPFVPMGRPMKEYVRAPAAHLAEPELLQPWIAQSLAFVRALPAKEPKSAKGEGEPAPAAKSRKKKA